jgi:superfamily II DNA or RNA helicase
VLIEAKTKKISLNPNPEEYIITYKLEPHEIPDCPRIIGLLYESLLTISIEDSVTYKTSIADFFILRNILKTRPLFNLNISPSCLEVCKKFMEHRFNIMNIKDGDINNQISTTLKSIPYNDQKSAIAFSVARKRGLNCSSVGVGKTLSALGAFNYLYDRNIVKKGVVFCLNENKLTWYNEILKHTNYSYSVVRNGSVNVCKDIDSFKGQLLVLHYDCIINEDVKASIISAGFDFWICDEAHVLRNADKKQKVSVKGTNIKRYVASSQRANTVFELCSAINPTYILLLTGTPIPEDPLHAYAIIKLLQPEWVTTRQRFEDHFCNFIHIKKRFSEKKIKIINKKNPYKNLDQLKYLFDLLSFRRTQDQCKDFPPTVLSTREFELHPVQQAFYDAIKNKEMNRLQNKKFDSVESALVETLRLRQCLSDPAILEDSAPSTKMVVLEQVVEEILSDSKNKIVVFSCFRPTIEAIVKKFKHHNAVMFAGINKDLKQEDRDGNITKFLTDPSCRLLIANSSLGAGGNWGQVARYGIFYDLPESRLDWKQSFGRITRRDAVGTSNIIVFLSHGTCEMKLWDALDTKNDTIDSILGKDQELTLDVRSILD